MYFPTNAGDSVALINAPWLISVRAMSPGQIKPLRNWPSRCNDHHEALHICTRVYAYLRRTRQRTACMEQRRNWSRNKQERRDTRASSATYDEDRCQRWLGTGVNGKTTKCFRWCRRRFKYTRDKYTNLGVASCGRFKNCSNDTKIWKTSER